MPIVDEKHESFIGDTKGIFKEMQEVAQHWMTFIRIWVSGVDPSDTGIKFSVAAIREDSVPKMHHCYAVAT